MERILLRNGIPEPMPRIEGTYLYQTLHVRGRRPLWLDRHTELLARNIQELFGLRWAPDLRRLEAEIAALLDANRHPVAGSSFVRMAFTPAGDLLLIPGAVSFYDGYALRSLRPAAAVVNYGVPYPEYPTSAREAACMLALQAAVTADNRAAEADIERAAVRTGVQAVIRCDGEGFVHVCDEAPLFAGPAECRTGIGMPGRRSRPPASAGAGDRPGATCPFRRNFLCRSPGPHLAIGLRRATLRRNHHRTYRPRPEQIILTHPARYKPDRFPLSHPIYNTFTKDRNTLGIKNSSLVSFCTHFHYFCRKSDTFGNTPGSVCWILYSFSLPLLPMSHTIAIFPGSFDPFTRGHQALVDDALRIFDKVVIGIGNNVSKAGLLRIEARKQLIEDLYADNPRVEVRIYTGLTGDFARDQHASAIIRGVRNTTDFEYERTMEATNHRLHPDIITVMLFTPAPVADIASSTVREVLAFGRTVDEFMPEGIDIKKYL